VKFEGGQWVRFAPAEKLATIFYTLWKYVQLLFVPHPLTCDYYPRHIGIMSFGNPFVLLSLALYGFLAYWVLRGFRQRDAVAFGILLFLLPLGIVSNFVFSVGTNMSERFAFMPSVGFCFLAGWFLNAWLLKNRSGALGLFAVVVGLFSLLTMLRNPVWESNDRLFMHDIAVSPNSIKLQIACAKVQVESAKQGQNAPVKRDLCQQAIGRANQALAEYPDFITAYIIRAEAYALNQQYPEAVADYRKALALSPQDPKRTTMLAFSLREGGKYYGQQQHDLANALKYLNESWQLNPKDPETARLLGAANVVQGKFPEALEWYGQSEAVASKDAGALWELSVAYANLNKIEKAEELRRRALAIDPAIGQKVANGQVVE
jgi:Flp pilus assembly protein TadD